MDDAVVRFVDYVPAMNAPAVLRKACSRDGILAGLERVGAFECAYSPDCGLSPTNPGRDGRRGSRCLFGFSPERKVEKAD